jgi:methylglutamate dehydrogenase subunit B
MQIKCPWCGDRAHTEFSFGGDAERSAPAAQAGPDAWHDYIYLRTNPKGRHWEYWHHVGGCRRWLRVLRDTATHEVIATELAGEGSEARS